jgi:uncharacterized protein YegJ (DUF2314 family)
MTTSPNPGAAARRRMKGQGAMPMMPRGVAFALLLLCWIGAAAAQAVVHVPQNDPEMAEAQAKARATLAEFWGVFERPGANEEGFALRVGVPYGPNNSEHMWFNGIERSGGKLTGALNNNPVHVRGLQRGQRIEIDEGRISDWMYLRSGKIVGNHTMRPLLKRLPPQEAARYRAMLADP